jgi:hypothetical protein
MASDHNSLASDELIASLIVSDGPVTDAESVAPPSEEVKEGILRQLSEIYFDIHGDDERRTARSEFFLEFNKRSRLTPYWRWCLQQDPTTKYAFTKDNWYRFWTSKLDARKRRKVAPVLPQPVIPPPPQQVPTVFGELSAMMNAVFELKQHFAVLEGKFETLSDKVEAFTSVGSRSQEDQPLDSPVSKPNLKTKPKALRPKVIKAPPKPVKVVSTWRARLLRPVFASD